MTNTTIHLISKTGICPNNYMYWASKEECDSWFLGKSKHTVTEYLYVRGDESSKHGYNVGCVHLDIPYNETTTCDYLSYKNIEYEDRWYHAQVIGREYVNEKTTRLYFVLDYVASYYDSIELGKSFIERTHVTDDWESKPSKTASKYLLSEPFSIEIRHRPEILGSDPMTETNFKIDPATTRFCLVTTVDEDGKFNEPKFRYQGGTPIGGYVYKGTAKEIEERLSKYVTYSNQVVTRQDSILSYVSDVYMAPLIVVGEEPVPTWTDIDKEFNAIFKGHYQPRHAKVLDYLRLRIVGNTADIMLSPAEYHSTMKAIVWQTGGPNGCFTLLMYDKTGKLNGQSCSSMPWPSVPFSGTLKANNYTLNNDAMKGGELPPIPQIRPTSSFAPYENYMQSQGK